MNKCIMTVLLMCSVSMADIIAPTPTPTPITPSQATVQLVKEQTTQMFVHIKATFTNLFNLVWHNPYKLSPQQVFDAFGKDASQLFVIAAATQNMMNSIRAGALPQVPPITYVVNADGTVVAPSPTPTPSPTPHP